MRLLRDMKVRLSKMKSLDTNILARWIVRDDDKQAKQVDLLLASLKKFYVSEVVFFELEHLMRSYYMMNRELVEEHFQSMIDSPYFDFNKKLWAEVFKLYLNYPGLSLADCYLAVSSKELEKYPLVTFDANLASKLPKLVELI